MPCLLYRYKQNYTLNDLKIYIEKQRTENSLNLSEEENVEGKKAFTKSIDLFEAIAI